MGGGGCMQCEGELTESNSAPDGSTTSTTSNSGTDTHIFIFLLTQANGDQSYQYIEAANSKDAVAALKFDDYDDSQILCSGPSATLEKEVTVHYNGHEVSDPKVRDALKDIAISTRQDVNVTSGNRNDVVQGSSTKSLHLTGHAADFHVKGMSDKDAFSTLMGTDSPIDKGFKLIRHGAFTATQGAHLHLESGQPTDQRSVFEVEGLTPQTKGQYTKIWDDQ
jgi:hypothetical protein